MTCADLGPQLTAYLDGELDGDRGTAVRGHLRTCEGCRALATREATLRDALRELPAVEPPASMWAGVQARLAAAEVAESERPAWRRTLSRWASALAVDWLAPRYLAGGVVVAALALVLVVHARHSGPGDAGGEGTPMLAHAIDLPSPVLGASTSQPAPRDPRAAGSGAGPTDGDVTAALAAEPAQITATYAATAGELVELALEVRATWSDAQRLAYDGKLGALRTAIARAPSDRDRQRTYRALIRFVQGALVRDDVTLASTGGAR